MSDKLYDSLETCLQALENGETIDAALKRFPALAADLRPILEASLHAKSLAGEAVADDVHRRGRARVLQRAAELREAKRAPRQRTWIFAMRPVAVTLMLLVFLLSGTSLVRASTTALPGDNLYAVKRTWEDVTLMFASGVELEDLELTYENERVEEINELLVAGRNEVVTFSGYVTSQTTSEWKVAGVPVLITVDTGLPAEPVNIGAAVTVSGTTNELGFLVAQTITPLPPGAVVPVIDVEENEGSDDDEENENGSSQVPPADGESSNSSGDEAEDDSEKIQSELKGVLESASGTIWVVNGQQVDVSGAEIVGTPAAGATVTIEGYYDANGVFIATKVVFKNGGGDSGSSDGSGDSSNDDSSDDNNNDDNGNEDNDNGDDENDNNDNGSGDDNSNDD